MFFLSKFFYSSYNKNEYVFLKKGKGEKNKMMKKTLKQIGCSVLTAAMCVGLLGTANVGAADTVELEIWTLLDETDAMAAAWEGAVADYEAAHPEVKINRTQYEGEAYKMKLKSAVAADELPDIFFSWAGGFSQPFAESGKLYALDDAYTNYADALNSSMLDGGKYGENIYGSVISPQTSLLYYNNKMFEEYGVKVPETFEELLTACQTFVDNGVAPIAISAKDTWGPAVIMDNLMLKCVGRDEVVNTITRKGGSFETEGFLEAAEKFSELVNMGAFLENASGVNTDEAYQYFVNGTCPMWVMIDSLGNNVMNTIENIEDYGVTRFPVVGDNAAITDMMGGCGEMYCVANSSENAEIAADAVFELTQSVAKYGSEAGTMMSAWNGNDLPDGIAEFMFDVQEYKADATSYMLWWDTTMQADDAQEYLALLQELYVGNITPEEFCEAMNDQLS